MLMLDLWLQAETTGVAHFGAYNRPPDGHFFRLWTWVEEVSQETTMTRLVMIFSLREAEYTFQHFESCGKKSTDAIIPDKSLVGRFTTNFMMNVREHYGHLQRAFFLNKQPSWPKPSQVGIFWEFPGNRVDRVCLGRESLSPNDLYCDWEKCSHHKRLEGNWAQEK